MKKILLIIIPLLVATAAVVYIKYPQVVSSVMSTPVLWVTSRGGGMCDGPCPMFPRYTLYADGVYAGHEQLTTDEVRQVQSFTVALAEYPSTTGHGDCQSYVDGTDSVWIIPSTGVEIIPCEYTDPSSLKMIDRINTILYK